MGYCTEKCTEFSAIIILYFLKRVLDRLVQETPYSTENKVYYPFKQCIRFTFREEKDVLSCINETKCTQFPDLKKVVDSVDFIILFRKVTGLYCLT